MFDNLETESDGVMEDEELIDEQSDSDVEDEEEIDADLEDSDDEEDDETLSINIDGEDITSEQIRELQQGNLRQADYTKKTTAAANEMKRASDIADDLQNTISSLESLLTDADDAQMEELLEDGDTAEYLRLKKANKSKLKVLSDAKKLAGKALEERQVSEGAALVEAMIEWQDPKTGEAKRKTDVEQALKYAETLGFTNDDLSKVSDHRVMRALIDAGRLAKAKVTASTKKKVKPSRKPATRKTKSTKEKSVVDLFYPPED